MTYIAPMSIPRGARSFGDDATTAAASPAATTIATPDSTFSLSDALESSNVKLASAALMAFHGYRRSNGSIFWTAIWALLGKWKPEYVVPVAVAQGYGRRKVWSTVEGPR